MISLDLRFVKGFADFGGQCKKRNLFGVDKAPLLCYNGKNIFGKDCDNGSSSSQPRNEYCGNARHDPLDLGNVGLVLSYPNFNIIHYFNTVGL